MQTFTVNAFAKSYANLLFQKLSENTYEEVVTGTMNQLKGHVSFNAYLLKRNKNCHKGKGKEKGLTIVFTVSILFMHVNGNILKIFEWNRNNSGH